MTIVAVRVIPTFPSLLDLGSISAWRVSSRAETPTRIQAHKTAFMGGSGHSG